MESKIVKAEDAVKASTEYFNGDEFAATTWINKYALKDGDNNLLELTPDDMHKRLAREIARIERQYPNPLSEDELYEVMKNFKYIIPQGGPMTSIGDNYRFQSLSNCFVIGVEEGSSDSYGAIFRMDEEQTQLCKRRGGVGHDLSDLRPEGALVTNAAGTSSGVVSFMERYSNSTREVAQMGRRGALMLSISVQHPDAEKFIDAKLEDGKVTGANISVKLTDEFMNAVLHEQPFTQRFPINSDLPWLESKCELSQNILYKSKDNKESARIINAKKLWDKIIHNAWKSAEPGVLFWDTIIRESPADCYSQFGYGTVSTNPCLTGETLVAVADGRNAVSIKQLAEENKEFPVYSARKSNSNGNKRGLVTEVKKAVAFKTGTKEVLEVKLSDGTSFKCTPDHRLALPDGSYVEAKDSVGLVLAKFYSHFRATGSTPHRLINSVSCHKQMHYIAGYYEIPGWIEGAHLHHIDGDSSNDFPENLEFLNGSDHLREHQTGSNNSVFSMNQELFKLLNKRKNILANASRYKLDSETIKSKLDTFDSEYGDRIAELRKLKNVHHDDIDLSYEVYVTEIIQSGVEDVYDLTVEDNHNFYIITRYEDSKYLNSCGVLVHNCGEIPLCPYDSCRLLAINLYSYVKNPFTPNAKFDEKLFIKHARIAQRMMDDIIDLEVEKIDAILNKIENDPESDDIKSVEKNLWLKIRKKTIEGRRTGVGITAEGDMLAALGLRYGSDEAIELATSVHKLLAVNCYTSSIYLAKERGCFKIWNEELESENPFIKRVLENVSEDVLNIYHQYGRRNISCLTIAPTGTTSIMSQTTSGIEPVFLPTYKRRRKTADKSKAVFIDNVGDMFEEYRVFHHKFIEWFYVGVKNLSKSVDTPIGRWCKEHPQKCEPMSSNEKPEFTFQRAKIILEKLSDEAMDSLYKISPYYLSTANDCDWVSKVNMQGSIQKWVDHSISCTVNLPSNVTEELVSDVYMAAYKSGCKGCTVYRDGDTFFS